MPWKTFGKYTYFYNSKMVNGKSRPNYVGNGAAAIAEAKRIEIRTQDLAATRALRRENVESDRMASELHTMIYDQIYSAMAEAGFHLHDGRWKKKKISPMQP